MAQITEDKRKFLEEVVGAVRAEQIIKEANERTKDLDEAGVRRKAALSFDDLDVEAVVNQIMGQISAIVSNVLYGADAPLEASEKVMLVAAALREAADRVGLKLDQGEAVSAAKSILAEKSLRDPAAPYAFDAGFGSPLMSGQQKETTTTLADIEAEGPAGPYVASLLRDGAVQGHRS